MQNLRLDRLPPPSKRVAVVVPLGSRPGISRDERISLAHIRHYLGEYDRHIIAPEGLPVDFADDFTIHRLDDRYFGSAQAHALMQLTPEFYERFLDYEYILMHHLDALALSDQLIEWCDRGFDFIGAPWFPTEDSPWVQEPFAGNSGFALMRVRSFLRVLYSPRRMRTVRESWSLAGHHFKGLHLAIARLMSLRRVSYWRNHVHFHARSWLDHGMAGDTFWSREAQHYWPPFRVATAEEALPFAFEAAPRECFERNGRQLPFGGHAWWHFDRTFWEPYLLDPAPEGAEKEAASPAATTAGTD